MSFTLARLLRSPALLAVCILPLFAVTPGCSAPSGNRERSEAEDRIDRLLSLGEFGEAVRLADEVREENPDDERLANAHRRASVAFLLNDARDASFRDDDVEALRILDEARAIAPESEQVANWTRKTRDKLSEFWVLAGLELHAQDNLPGAIEAYENALRYAPGDGSAAAGIDTAREVAEYREARGRDYFKSGLSAKADYLLDLALGEMGRTLKYLREEERVLANRTEVRELLAEDRVLSAQTLQGDGRWAAARNEFRLALLYDEDNKEALEGFELAGRETEASNLVKDARMKIIRGQLDDARSALNEARSLTVLQQDMLDGLEAEIEQSGYEEIYVEGRSSERDRDYPAAVAAYGRLLAEATYYKDALQRKKTLEDNIVLAAETYDRASAEADPTEKLLIFREINDIIWPGYRDVRQRIQSLEAQLESSGS